MENEQNQELELENQNEGGTGADEGEAKPKPRLTPEQEEGIKKRQFTRLAKELGVELPKPQTETPKKEGFDYGEKAYLKASGLNSDEFDFAHEVMVGTGKSLDEVLEAKYFQSELKERREAKAAKDAIPTGTKRSAPASTNQVDYWLNKPIGEVPEELKREVINARLKIESNKSKFTSRPIGNQNY